MVSLQITFLLALLHLAASSPIAKVLELLGNMQANARKNRIEAEERLKEYDLFCDTRAGDLGSSIRSSSVAKQELEARISKAEGTIQSLSRRLQEAISGIESDEANLESVTSLRNKEKAQFESAQKDLTDSAESMQQAVRMLEKASKGRGKSGLLQFQEAPDAQATINALASGATGAADTDGLAALLQISDKVPSIEPLAYESGSIVDLLEDMQDKASTQINELRAKEESARHGFEMLQQSLQDQITFAKNEVSKLKTELAQTKVAKTGDAKDLQEAETSLVADQKELDDLAIKCRIKRDSYRIEQRNVVEELEALDTAKAALVEKTGVSGGQGYSFLQVMATDDGPAGIVTMLQEVATRTNSTSLALLSRQIHSLIRSDLTSGVDRLEKIRGMISDMIGHVEQEIRKAADKKAYCDAELAKAKDNHQGKKDELDDLRTKIDAALSKTALLKAEASNVQKALTALAESEAKLTQLRQREKAQFEQTIPELKGSIDSVKIALKVLREYYGGEEASRSTSNRGTATSVIGLLEVVESDAMKNVAQLQVAEASAQADFTKTLQDMEMERARKEKDVQHKTQAARRLGEDVQELQKEVKEGELK
ncbi:unnamed protein product [Durusdinium trenchii]|uniref:Uncharacterized protein n=1 Tax=Durusdinium trenchii TaxID=1381693 RepID=A0ABP0H774_9DINO